MKRMTRQRSAILKCFTKIKRPLSVDEILSISAEEIPEINLSTIYRNLKTLLKENVINLVELPGSQGRYELIQKKHHHHFLCEMCNCLFNIPQCPQGLIDIVPKGFQLRGHSITLSGLCIDCIKGPAHVLSV